MTKTVLVIEDNMLHRKLFAAWLQKAGHEPVLVPDERLAYLEAVSRQPDAIITDIRLPYVDGREIIRQLKASPLTQHIPIMAITVLSGKTDEDSCRSAGADVFLTKTIRMAAFIKEVDAITA
ncbi:response regulator [Sphingomonas echinoides]|uniref:response regulator n=1 Tax=Sphingomonas echinoides TaxID=59803 RepID=UPI0024139D2E|nr:response regulator [Sphingomonas echinoides]